MQQMGTMQQRTSGAWASPPWRCDGYWIRACIAKGLVLASVEGTRANNRIQGAMGMKMAGEYLHNLLARGEPPRPLDCTLALHFSASALCASLPGVQLAQGEPPRVNVASFRLLFMIVRDDPPQVGSAAPSTMTRGSAWM